MGWKFYTASGIEKVSISREIANTSISATVTQAAPTVDTWYPVATISNVTGNGRPLVLMATVTNVKQNTVLPSYLKVGIINTTDNVVLSHLRFDDAALAIGKGVGATLIARIDGFTTTKAFTVSMLSSSNGGDLIASANGSEIVATLEIVGV